MSPGPLIRVPTDLKHRQARGVIQNTCMLYSEHVYACLLVLYRCTGTHSSLGRQMGLIRTTTPSQAQAHALNPKNCAHTYVRAVSLKLCSVLGSRITLETKIRYLYCFQLVLSISTCDPNARSRLTPRSSSSSPPSPSFATRTASQQGLTCSPCHPPHIERMLATSPTVKCTGARHITHREVYRCSPVIHREVYRCSPRRADYTRVKSQTSRPVPE